MRGVIALRQKPLYTVFLVVLLEVYVGTSGWLYDWNLGMSFDWYLRHSGLNAVELNASFYRFPFPNQVSGWRKKTESSGIRWSVKVHRSITHLRKLSEKSLATWSRFRDLFKPLEDYIDFYLFQMPPTFRMSKDSVARLRSFAEATHMGSRLAIEFREPGWFSQEATSICLEVGATPVSIDSPIGTWVVSSNDVVYLRMHGREAWYSYEYSDEELGEMVGKLANLSPKKVYVFFNNDHWMLDNARTMMKLLREKLRD